MLYSLICDGTIKEKRFQVKVQSEIKGENVGIDLFPNRPTLNG